MLNSIWPIFLIISFIYGISFGNISETNSAIFNATEDAVNLTIKLLGTICLWNGIMKIAEKTSLIKKIKSMLRPIIKFLFPNLHQEEEAYQNISMNMVANIMGLRECCNSYGVKGNEIFTRKK